jgi:hypothetical protein
MGCASRAFHLRYLMYFHMQARDSQAALDQMIAEWKISNNCLNFESSDNIRAKTNVAAEVEHDVSI